MKTLKLIGHKEHVKDFRLHDNMVIGRRELDKLTERIRKIEIQLDYQTKKILINKNSSIHFISICDIMYCQADGNYCTIHLRNGEKYISSKTLKKVESKISHPTFLRIHQSYLVNGEYIKSVQVKGKRGIICNSGLIIPISKRFNLEKLTL